jgi:hypothetical protein
MRRNGGIFQSLNLTYAQAMVTVSMRVLSILVIVMVVENLFIKKAPRNNNASIR